MGKAGDLHDLFDDHSLFILLTLLCDALLRERTSPAFFPVMRPYLRNGKSQTENGNHMSSWRIVKCDGDSVVKAVCNGKDKLLSNIETISCLAFRNSNLQDVVGLVDLVSPTGSPVSHEQLDGFVRMETDRMSLSEGQVLLPIHHGAAFLHHHVQLEDNGSFTESQTLLSVLQRAAAPYKTWIYLRRGDCALPTPVVYIRYSSVNESWEARLADVPSVRIFGSRQFALDEVDEFLVCVAQYVRFKIVLLYASLPFFYDTAQVEFTVEPASSRAHNSSRSRYQAGELVQYQVKSWESNSVYVSVLWLQSDGSIVLLKDCEQLPTRSGTNGAVRLPNQMHHMISDGATPCTTHVFCLFVSDHFCSFESLQQQIGNSSSLSPSFLLSLPVMKDDTHRALQAGASWRSRGFCSLLHTFEVL